MTARPALATPSDWRRHPGAIAVAVVALHAAGLWALQSGLLRRAVETVVPAEILVEMLDASPAPAPTPPAPQATEATAKQAPATASASPSPTAAPTALAVPAPAPSPVNTPPTVATISGAADAVSTRATSQFDADSKAPKAVAVAPTAAPKIELPNSDVAELNNPRSKYPALSWRLGEEGVVVVSILVGTDGSAKEVRLAKSSGFDRLDQAALADAQKLRFVPGKVDGVPQAMWRDKPFNYQLTRP